MFTTLLIAVAVLGFAYAAYSTARTVQRVLAIGGFDETLDRAEDTLLDLVSEKRAVLDTLKASELDRETGKLDDAEYEDARKSALARAVQLTRALDDARHKLQFSAQISADLAELETLRSSLVRRRPRTQGGESLSVWDEPSGSGGGASEAAELRRARKPEATPEKGLTDLPPEELTDLVSEAKRILGALKVLDGVDADAALANAGEVAEAVRTGAGDSNDCPECSLALPKAAKFCPECGHRIAQGAT